MPDHKRSEKSRSSEKSKALEKSQNSGQHRDSRTSSRSSGKDAAPESSTGMKIALRLATLEDVAAIVEIDRFVYKKDPVINAMYPDVDGKRSPMFKKAIEDHWNFAVRSSDRDEKVGYGKAVMVAADQRANKGRGQVVASICWSLPGDPTRPYIPVAEGKEISEIGVIHEEREPIQPETIAIDPNATLDDIDRLAHSVQDIDMGDAGGDIPAGFDPYFAEYYTNVITAARYGVFGVSEQNWMLESVATAPEYQRMGIASSLVISGLELARSHGMDVFIPVFTDTGELLMKSLKLEIAGEAPFNMPDDDQTENHLTIFLARASTSSENKKRPSHHDEKRSSGSHHDEKRSSHYDDKRSSHDDEKRSSSTKESDKKKSSSDQSRGHGDKSEHHRSSREDSRTSSKDSRKQPDKGSSSSSKK